MSDDSEPADGTEASAPSSTPPPGGVPFDAINDNVIADTVARVLELARAMLGLLAAELRLARHSALALLWLAAALLVLAFGALFSVNALLATLIYRLSGDPLIGVGSVVVVNVGGLVAVVHAMRRRAGDLTLPRTRRMLARRPSP